MRTVAVFDADLPPGVAFLRSLGQAGVPVTAYATSRFTAGRFSRYADAARVCPPVGTHGRLRHLARPGDRSRGDRSDRTRHPTT